MTTSVNVVVHQDRCAASGQCRSLAPTVFGATSDGWVVLLDQHPDDQLDQVLDAHDACPLAAIEVLDDEGNSVA